MPVLESMEPPATLLKGDFNTGIFLWILQNFYKHLYSLKKIYKRLLLKMSKCIWILYLYLTPQTQDVNWTNIRRSEVVQDVFWTSYVRSIYVLYLRGNYSRFYLNSKKFLEYRDQFCFFCLLTLLTFSPPLLKRHQDGKLLPKNCLNFLKFLQNIDFSTLLER